MQLAADVHYNQLECEEKIGPASLGEMSFKPNFWPPILWFHHSHWCNLWIFSPLTNPPTNLPRRHCSKLSSSPHEAKQISWRVWPRQDLFSLVQYLYGAYFIVEAYRTLLCVTENTLLGLNYLAEAKHPSLLAKMVSQKDERFMRLTQEYSFAPH